MVLFLAFFVAIMPAGLVLRALGIDYLNRKIDRNAKTYWNK